MIALFGQLLLDLVRLCRRLCDFSRRQFSANGCKSRTQALPVTVLQLKAFGVDVLLVNLHQHRARTRACAGGRSSMTAQIGVMRVTEEIDALATVGVSLVCASN